MSYLHSKNPKHSTVPHWLGLSFMSTFFAYQNVSPKSISTALLLMGLTGSSVISRVLSFQEGCWSCVHRLPAALQIRQLTSNRVLRVKNTIVLWANDVPDHAGWPAQMWVLRRLPLQQDSCGKIMKSENLRPVSTLNMYKMKVLQEAFALVQEQKAKAWQQT